VKIIAPAIIRLVISAWPMLSQARLTSLRTVALAKAPIACVEGWSAVGEWTGVRLRDLLDLVDAPAGSTVRVDSLQSHGPFRYSEVRGNLADDPKTLVALALAGEPLDLDHGYPARLIAPNRPGVLQTKWLARIEVT
jgi:DMSO/TMAO reductase YedYZ molybdopterin-dependent catalytic subunit